MAILIGELSYASEEIRIVNFENVIVEDLAEAITDLELVFVHCCKDLILVAVRCKGIKPIARILGVSPKTLRSARDNNDCTRVGIKKGYQLTREELWRAITAL